MSTTTHLVQVADGELVYSTDPDTILDAYQAGRTVERVHAPVSACGCPRCTRVTEPSEDLAQLMRSNRMSGV